MKYIATIVLFFSCVLAFAQQESNVFSISPEHPAIGSDFTVTYNAAAPTAKLKDATGIELYSLVFRNGDDPLFLDLPMKKEGNRWTASGQIADKFETSWATISRHLSVLKDSGLILAERNGQHVVYELNTTVFQDVVEHLIKWLRPRRPNA